MMMIRALLGVCGRYGRFEILGEGGDDRDRRLPSAENRREEDAEA